MGYDKNYSYIYKELERVRDRELGKRYHTDEAKIGESFTEFKNRIVKEEKQSIKEKKRTIYPAWIKMPDETMEEFKKRLTAKRINDGERIPAWVKAPGETDEQFKKRFKSLPKSL